MGISLIVKKNGELEIEAHFSDIQIDQIGSLITRIKSQLSGDASTKVAAPSELKPPVQIAVPATKPLIIPHLSSSCFASYYL